MANVNAMLRYLIGFLCWLLLSPSARADVSVDGKSWTRHSLHYWYEDEQRNVAELASKAVWKPSADGWIRKSKLSWHYWADFSRERLWLKVQLDPEAIGSQNLWLAIHASGASHASLFYKKNGEFIELDSRSPNWETTHGIPQREIAFQIKKSFESETLYLLVESPIKFDVQINHALESEFLTDNQSSLFFFAFLYGLLIVMVIYNIIVGKYLQESIYHFYALSTLFGTMHQFLAHGHMRLFVNFDWDIAIRLMIVTALITLVWIALFIRKLLSLQKYTPKADTFVVIYAKVLAVVTVLALVLPTHWALLLCLVLGAPSSTIALVVSYNAHRNGSPMAKVFLFAWSVYFIGATLWIAYWMGLVPLTPIVEQSFLLGMSVEAVLLSIVLAYRIQMLKNQKQKLLASQSQLKEMSFIDAMAGIGNRRAFDVKINQLVASSASFGLALADVDHFKNFNDTWGHAEGDTVIRRLGELMLHLFSDRYHVYRIGGEEFAIIFESVNKEEMANAVDLLRREFSALEFSVGGEAAVNCTLSAGYDSRLPDETVLSLFKRVDDALYQAKRSGRNRICAAENFCSIVKDESVSTIA